MRVHPGFSIFVVKKMAVRALLILALNFVFGTPPCFTDFDWPLNPYFTCILNSTLNLSSVTNLHGATLLLRQNGAIWSNANLTLQNFTLSGDAAMNPLHSSPMQIVRANVLTVLDARFEDLNLEASSHLLISAVDLLCLRCRFVNVVLRGGGSSSLLSM